MPDNWETLSTEDQIDSIISESHKRPQIIFKHSTRCSISSRAYQRLDSIGPKVNDKADIYYLDVIASRPISNSVAARFKIPHESPQLLIISDEQVILHKSHGAIQEEVILNAIQNHKDQS